MIGARMNTASSVPGAVRAASSGAGSIRATRLSSCVPYAFRSTADVHQPQALLRRVGDLARHQDRARAGAEHRLAPAEFRQRLEQLFRVAAASAWSCSRRPG